MACDACLLNTPTNFIAPFKAPPVTLDVSVYLKSARAGTLSGAISKTAIVTFMIFTAFPPRAKEYKLIAACLHDVLSEFGLPRPGPLRKSRRFQVSNADLTSSVMCYPRLALYST